MRAPALPCLRGRCVLLTALSLLAFAFLTAAAPPAAPKELPNGSIPVLVSSDTTFVTEPLNPDGTVNYVAALNKALGQGVTPDQNAGTALCEIMGPAICTDDVRQQLFATLGARMPRAEECFVTIEAFAAAQAKAQGQDEAAAAQAAADAAHRASGALWATETYPVVTAWLEANQRHLDAMVAAAKRPHCYIPLLTTDTPPQMRGALMPTLGSVRALSRALCCRAMLRTHAGNLAGAHADLLASLRWARLTGQGPMLLHSLVGISGVTMIRDPYLALARSGQLNAASAKAILTDFGNLPTAQPVFRAIDVGERWAALDTIMDLQRRGAAALVEPEAQPPGAPAPAPTADTPLVADYPRLVQDMNTRVDELVAALRVKDQATRKQKLEALSAAWKERGQRARTQMVDPAFSQKYDAATSQAKRDLLTPVLSDLLPSVLLVGGERSQEIEDRAEVDFALLRVALALVAYRAEKGQYPAQLTDLEPNYLLQVPTDRFSGQPFIYRVEGGGCIVYSLGANLVDDGGNDEGFRDHVVRLPAPAR